jgi:methylenetetrahydrofolate reductase (NADPH)
MVLGRVLRDFAPPGIPLMDAASATRASKRAAELIASCSIEVTPKDHYAGERLRELFEPGLTVFVNFPPRVTHHDSLAACARLRRAGFEPVPHIPARQLLGFSQANDFLARAVTEAGVTRVLVLGGDAARPAGPFQSALDLLATGLVEKHGISAVAFAGYPEGHARIDAHVLEAALRAKLALARTRGLMASVVTQFAFEAEPILAWVAALRRDGIDCPVHIGLAGPASIAMLARYAVRCGIGASLRALARGHTDFAHVLTEANPGALVEGLAARESGTASIDGVHIFTFGGVRRAAGWIKEAATWSVRA